MWHRRRRLGPATPASAGARISTLRAQVAALEAAASLLSIEHGLIPPTANTTTVDPELTIDVVTGEARPWTPAPVISNNFGFGGHNGSVIFAPPT